MQDGFEDLGKVIRFWNRMSYAVLTCSSRSHSRNTNFRSPHSIVKTSESIDADVALSCTPDRSSVLGFVVDACC